MNARPTNTRHFILFDGRCTFCRTQVCRLIALARRDAIEAVDFQEAGALDRFPGIRYDACMRAMHLVTPGGKVYTGFEAIARALATRRVIGILAYIYYIPGIRQFCDWLYRLVAANRYRIMRAGIERGDCPDGTCALHLHQDQGLKAKHRA